MLELTIEQVEEVICTELEKSMMESWGMPEKTLKAMRRVYKWYSEPSRQDKFLRELDKREEY